MKLKSNKKLRGFSIEEVLTIIVIIGIIATIIVSAISGIRASSRDVQRVTDIDSIHTALEMYYRDNNYYPETLTVGNPLASPSGQIYLNKIPKNPFPNDDGECMSDTNYTYAASIDYNFYTLIYCLGKHSGEIEAGEHTATPEGTTAGDPEPDPAPGGPAQPM